MRTLLALEGAVSGSVAVIRDGRLASSREVAGGNGRSDLLMPAILDALRDVTLTLDDVDAVLCGAGPGSFTGLRIAGSLAKGIALGRGVPLFAIPSMLLMVASVEPPLPEGRYEATLDALRGECFVAPVDVLPNTLRLAEPVRIVARDALGATHTAGAPRGVGVCGDITASPHARGAYRLLDSLEAFGPVDLVAWEPDYGRLAEAQVRWERAAGRPLAG